MSKYADKLKRRAEAEAARTVAVSVSVAAPRVARRRKPKELSTTKLKDVLKLAVNSLRKARGVAKELAEKGDCPPPIVMGLNGLADDAAILAREFGAFRSARAEAREQSRKEKANGQ